MSDPNKSTDELAGTEQPFVQHLVELRDRLMYSLAGVAVAMVLYGVVTAAAVKLTPWGYGR